MKVNIGLPRPLSFSGSTPSAPSSREIPYHSPRARRARIRGHIEHAKTIKDILDGPGHPKAATVARDEGITRARVSQLLCLLQLAPEILDDFILDSDAPCPTERMLRSWSKLEIDGQLEAWGAFLGGEGDEP